MLTKVETKEGPQYIVLENKKSKRHSAQLKVRNTHTDQQTMKHTQSCSNYVYCDSLLKTLTFLDCGSIEHQSNPEAENTFISSLPYIALKGA